MNTPQFNLKDVLIKGLFILGIFLIVLILAFAIVKITPRIFTSLTTVGNVIKSPFGNNDITIEANDTELYSGQKTIVFWDHEPEEFGTYDVKYPCIDDLEVIINTNNTEKKLLCNIPYKLNSSINSIEIIPTLNKKNALVNLPLSVKFTTESGNTLDEGSINFTVKNKSEQSEEDDSTEISSEIINSESRENSVTQTQTTSFSNLNYYSPGKPDLIITNLMAISNEVVSFQVSNIGSGNTGNWFFNYIRPDGKIEFSPLQVSLRPAETILYTLNFNGIPSGSVLVNLDPSNIVAEINEKNNLSAVIVAGAGAGIGKNSDYNKNDRADLEITLLEVGKIRNSNFVEDDKIDEDEDAAVRFIVKNIGGESTGTWRFEISNIPYDNESRYRSGRRDSLKPGESREIITIFENPNEGNYRIKVKVDSENDVREEDERNNEETERLEVKD